MLLESLNDDKKTRPIIKLLEEKNSTLLTNTLYLNQLSNKKHSGALLFEGLLALTQEDPHLLNHDLIYGLTQSPENAVKIVEALSMYREKMSAAPCLAIQQVLIQSGFYAPDVCEALISYHSLKEPNILSEQELQMFVSIAPNVAYVLYGFSMVTAVNPELRSADIFRLFFDNAAHIDSINLGLACYINFEPSLLNEFVLTVIISSGANASRVGLGMRQKESPLLLSQSTPTSPKSTKKSDFQGYKNC